MSPAPQTAARCPALFGSDGTRAANAAARRRLYWLDEESEGITVAHSSDSWGEPAALRLEGLRLLQTGQGEARWAEVEVSPRLAAKAGCTAGSYQLRADDDLAPGVRILAVVGGGLLLERGGRLAHLRAPGARNPRWLMAWSAPGLVRAPEPVGRSYVGYQIY